MKARIDLSDVAEMPRELEAWSPGIRLFDEWFYYDEPEPRLGAHRLLGKIPPVGGGYRVVRYRLGALPTQGQGNRPEKERW